MKFEFEEQVIEMFNFFEEPKPNSIEESCRGNRTIFFLAENTVLSNSNVPPESYSCFNNIQFCS